MPCVLLASLDWKCERSYWAGSEGSHSGWLRMLTKGEELRLPRWFAVRRLLHVWMRETGKCDAIWHSQTFLVVFRPWESILRGAFAFRDWASCFFSDWRKRTTIEMNTILIVDFIVRTMHFLQDTTLLCQNSLASVNSSVAQVCGVEMPLPSSIWIQGDRRP